MVKTPHIILMLTDDLGFNSPGYRNTDLITPTLDHLALKEGFILENFYAYKYCAPTRGSVLTGRFPYKLASPEKNFIPWWTRIGTHLGYTMLPAKLKLAGYQTHHIGKWHQGFFTKAYTPKQRGFDTVFGFLVGGEDHYTQDASWSTNCSQKSIDLWDNGMPAFGKNGSGVGDDAHYNGYTFTQRAVELIQNHSASRPMFMYYALHNTHVPIEAPSKFVRKYNYSLQKRCAFDAMVSVVDSSVENVTRALKETGMWNNTLFIWTTDNGSPVNAGGSNDPLRGGKGSNWEGGTRVPAFVSGGYLPSTMFGKRLNGLAHVADFYNTFAAVAGLEPGDPSKTAPAPQDSLNLWPYWSGSETESARNEIIYDHRMSITYPKRPNTTGAIRVGDYKLIVGTEKQASWFGHFTPNATFNRTAVYSTCSVAMPCLFNLRSDPTEHIDLLQTKPVDPESKKQLKKLMKRFIEIESEYHPPPNPRVTPEDVKGYCAHITENHGFVGPWVD